MTTPQGKLEVICGPMFSGKSEELMRRLRRAKIAQQNVIVFKPSLDNRYSIEKIVSHAGSSFEAHSIENPEMLLDYINQESAYVIGLDEVQFFSASILTIICKLINNGHRIICAGLDLDFRGVPFGTIPTLLAIADTITKLSSICTPCGNDAHFSQRLINGSPAKFNDPIIMVGAQEAYQARCRACFSIDQLPSW
jgi:thymidine kinase